MQELLTALRAAGEHTRLRILNLLRDSELTVSELVNILDQSQPRVSRHLKLLCDAGLLERYQDGAWVFHRLSDSGSAAEIGRGIMQLMDGDDEQIQRDSERLESIKAANAERADSYFKQNAQEWDEIRRHTVADEDVENRLAALLTTTGTETLLDVGTGTGRILTLLADRIGQGIGIDQSREMLEVARQNLGQNNITNCICKRADARNLPLSSSSVNIVIIHQVLHYLDQPEVAVREAARVMQTNSQMMVIDFLPHDLEFLRQEHAHRRLGFSEKTVAQWCSNTGLRLLDCEILQRERSGSDSLAVAIWKIRKP
ncbi:MAG: metalloregulator ArsR/SmtB family transcription factor [Pseudomonadota bacterium]